MLIVTQGCLWLVWVEGGEIWNFSQVGGVQSSPCEHDQSFHLLSLPGDMPKRSCEGLERGLGIVILPKSKFPCSWRVCGTDFWYRCILDGLVLTLENERTANFGVDLPSDRCMQTESSNYLPQWDEPSYADSDRKL